MSTPESAPPAVAQPQTITVTLTTPIARGDASIAEVTLRKPKTGELRSLKVEDVFNTDVNTLFVLLPRITQPTLTQADVANLETEDLLEIAGAVKGFFMSAPMREAIAKAVGG